MCVSDSGVVWLFWISFLYHVVAGSMAFDSSIAQGVPLRAAASQSKLLWVTHLGATILDRSLL